MEVKLTKNERKASDIGATLTSQMAIDPHTEIVDMTDRPFPLVRGEVISAIL